MVAFLGASFAARTLSPAVADALEPKFAAAIEEQLNESIRQQAEAGEAAVLSPDDVPAILEGRNRTAAGPTVPPGGLYMTRLWYGEDVL